MKKIVFILIAFITFNSVNAQNTTIDPSKLTRKDFEGGKVKHLKEIHFSGDDYQIINSPSFKGYKIKFNGSYERHGVYIQYNNKDWLRSTTTYYYGLKHGQYVSYHSNGKKEFEYSFEKNLRQGISFQYNPDGSLFQEKTYKDDDITGIRITYNKNGTKSFEVMMMEGLKQGEGIHYDSNGIPTKKSMYKDDNKIGKTIKY